MKTIYNLQNLILLKKKIYNEISYNIFGLIPIFIMSLSAPVMSQITRTQIITNAVPYTTYTWTATSANIWNGVNCGGKNIQTPSWVIIGSNTGMPYCWGGWTTTSAIQGYLNSGKSAGDNNTAASFGAEPTCAVGLDCSGFVSRAWQLSKKYSTSTLPNVSTAITLTQTQPGDIVNKAGSHVRLIETNYGNGTYRVIESSGADWKTAYHSYTASQLSTYTPRKYNNVIDVSPPAITVSSDSLPDFGSVIVGQYSSPKTYSVSGNNLTSGLYLGSPSGFQISLNSSAGYVDSLILSPSGGTVPATTIYVRFDPQIEGSQNGNIAHMSTGAAGKYVFVRGTGSHIMTPTVTTTTATKITKTSAVSGGNVTSDGGAAVIYRGVCWSTGSNPTIDSFKTSNGTGTGSFSSSITGLSAGVLYHYRAYATNSAGTGYGNDLTFRTKSSPILSANISEYLLGQNYPNPFNPSTIIKYELPMEEMVSLKIYDLLGREIKTLVNEYQSAGKYHIDFNAGGLPSGIYLYKLSAGNFTSIRKLILIK